MRPLSRRTIVTIIIAVCIVALIILGALYQGRRVYESYDVKDSFETDGAQKQNFVPFAGGLLAYSRDGAQYYDSNGLTIWNESYNMPTPVVMQCKERLLIYDRQGSTVVVMSPEKELSVISTNHTIVRADIASDGTVAVLTQENDTGYINLYSDDGKSIAGGQVHLSQTGYPMSIALSDDGRRLIASFEYASGGSLAARINIYDFSSAGEKHKNNIIATFEYENTICPQTGFFSDGSAIAFTDGGVRIFSSGTDVKETGKIDVKTETESVLTGDKYFGLIHRNADNRQILTVYSEDGKKAYTRKLRSSYSGGSFIGSDMIMEQSGKRIEIYDVSGRKRFDYSFPDEVIAFVPTDDEREFFLVQKNTSQIIRLS